MKYPCFNPQTTTSSTNIMLLFWTIISATAVLLVGFPAHAQQDSAQIAVNVEPRVVPVGGRLTYTIEISTPNNDHIVVEREPNFGELQVVGRMNAPQFTLRNNVASRHLTVTYTLAAPRDAKIIRIEPPIIQVGQSRYTPVSLDVKIVDQADLPPPKQSTDHHFYLDVDVTPDRQPYVGEQILISYDLMVDTRKIQVRPHPPSEPALDAFWVEDLSDQTSGQRKMVSVGSRLLERTGLRKFIAFPLNPGPATIDAMTVPLVRGSFFGPTTQLSLSSDEFSINVQPLPDGAPPGFHAGNIGQWKFNASLNQHLTNVGESITLTLKAGGRGRASQLQFGKLPPIDGLRVVNDTVKSERKIIGTTLHGTKTQTITLMPLKEGQITIPAISFSYFDPETSEYKTESTRPMTFNVGPGQLPPEPEPEELSVSRTTHNPEDITAKLIASMQPELDPQQSHAKSQNTFNWFAATPPVFGILLLLFGPRLVRRKSGSNRTKKQQKTLWTSINAQIAQAESQTDDPKAGYAILATALNTYFIECLNFPPGALSQSDLRPFLTQHKVPTELQTELFSIANTCNTARFAPSSSFTHKDILALATQLRTALKQLDKHLVRQKYPTRTSAVSLIFLITLTLFTLPAQASKQASETPSNKTPTSTLSATEWQQRADANPTDPILQYNTGSAFVSEKNYPMARLYLERASLLAPGHPAIHQNLGLIREIIFYNATSKRHPRFSEPLGGWQTAASTSPKTLNTIFIAALWLAFLALLVHRIASIKPSIRTAHVQTAATALLWISLTIFVLNIAAVTTRTIILHNANPAILTAESPALREGPSAYAALTRTSNRTAPGMMVNILETRDGWQKVEISDTTQGWMHTDDLISVRP